MSKNKRDETDLTVELGEYPDYDHAVTLPNWQLSDAVCYLLRLCPTDYGKSKWPLLHSAVVIEEYERIYEAALSDVSAKKLKTTDQSDKERADKDQIDRRVGVLVWLEWARDRGVSIPAELEGIQPGRELQKRKTSNRKAEVLQDANQVKSMFIERGRQFNKDSIAAELQKLPKYEGRSSAWLLKNFRMVELDE